MLKIVKHRFKSQHSEQTLREKTDYIFAWKAQGLHTPVIASQRMCLWDFGSCCLKKTKPCELRYEIFEFQLRTTKNVISQRRVKIEQRSLAHFSPRFMSFPHAFTC